MKRFMTDTELQGQEASRRESLELLQSVSDLVVGRFDGASDVAAAWQESCDSESSLAEPVSDQSADFSAEADAWWEDVAGWLDHPGDKAPESVQELLDLAAAAPAGPIANNNDGEGLSADVTPDGYVINPETDLPHFEDNQQLPNRRLFMRQPMTGSTSYTPFDTGCGERWDQMQKDSLERAAIFVEIFVDQGMKRRRKALLDINFGTSTWDLPKVENSKKQRKRKGANWGRKKNCKVTKVKESPGNMENQEVMDTRESVTPENAGLSDMPGSIQTSNVCVDILKHENKCELVETSSSELSDSDLGLTTAASCVVQPNHNSPMEQFSSKLPISQNDPKQQKYTQVKVHSVPPRVSKSLTRSTGPKVPVAQVKPFPTRVTPSNIKPIPEGVTVRQQQPAPAVPSMPPTNPIQERVTLVKIGAEMAKVITAQMPTKQPAKRQLPQVSQRVVMAPNNVAYPKHTMVQSNTLPQTAMTQSNQLPHMVSNVQSSPAPAKVAMVQPNPLPPRYVLVQPNPQPPQFTMVQPNHQPPKFVMVQPNPVPLRLPLAQSSQQSPGIALVNSIPMPQRQAIPQSNQEYHRIMMVQPNQVQPTVAMAQHPGQPMFAMGQLNPELTNLVMAQSCSVAPGGSTIHYKPEPPRLPTTPVAMAQQYQQQPVMVNQVKAGQAQINLIPANQTVQFSPMVSPPKTPTKPPEPTVMHFPPSKPLPSDKPKTSPRVFKVPVKKHSIDVNQNIFSHSKGQLHFPPSQPLPSDMPKASARVFKVPVKKNSMNLNQNIFSQPKGQLHFSPSKPLPSDIPKASPRVFKVPVKKHSMNVNQNIFSQPKGQLPLLSQVNNSASNSGLGTASVHKLQMYRNADNANWQIPVQQLKRQRPAEDHSNGSCEMSNPPAKKLKIQYRLVSTNTNPQPSNVRKRPQQDEFLVSGGPIAKRCKLASTNMEAGTPHIYTVVSN